MTILLHKRSTVANIVPTLNQIQIGELAINAADERVYFRNSLNQIRFLVSDSYVSSTNFTQNVLNFPTSWANTVLVVRNVSGVGRVRNFSGITVSETNNDVNFSGNLTVAQNVDINGTLTASVKNFVIKHPTKPNYKLCYSSVESNFISVKLSGKSCIKKDSKKAIVELPDYLKDLCRDGSERVMITNYGHSNLIYVSKIELNKNRFEVETRLKAKKDLEFFWEITLERKDVPKLQTEIPEKTSI